MSAEPVPVTIEILDKEYMVSCPPDEKEALLESAHELNERLKHVRDSGKVLGTERMAVITALNIVHELHQQQRHQVVLARTLNEDIKRLEEKIGVAVGRRRSAQALD